MDFYDVLKECGAQANISMRSIGARLGHNLSYVANQKSMGRTPSVTSAARMLDVCGYALVAVPKDSVTEDSLVIDPKGSK